MAEGALNWREIDLVLDELDLAGCLVQEVHQPAHDRVVLDLYRPARATAEGPGGVALAAARLSLLVCLSNRFPRLHAVTERAANPSKAPRFAMFLRAHVKGGRIASASQVGRERVVRMVVEKGSETCTLWIRLWAAASNLIATDEAGLILDAFYRRPKRGEVSGGRYGGPAARSERSERAFAVRDLAGEGTFNERLERYFGGLESCEDAKRLTAQAEAELALREAKLAATLEKLEARRSEYANLERWRELGELITSNLHLVKKGDPWLRVEDWHHGGAPVDIELAPDLPPSQNAERYYERYRKARDGIERLEEDIAELRRSLAEVEAEQELLRAQPDRATVRHVRRSALPPGTAAVSRAAGERPPGLSFSSPPFRILVGRSSRENDELLRRHVRGNDWWFHARDWPGAYVFVKTPAGKSPPLEVMLDAANLAIHFSRGKSGGGGDVYYTQVKHLRRAKGGPRGLVLPTQEKNLSVKLDPARIERLKSGNGPPAPSA